MRIPRNKLYRAFPELDVYTDRQCELLMRRVKLHPSASAVIILSAIGAAVAGVVFGSVLLAVGEALGFDRWFSEHWYRDADLLWATASVLVTPVVFAGLTRDLLLRRYLLRAIELRIDRVRCPSPRCRYILIGQAARGGVVSCPECGTATRLEVLGITAADLIPPASREEELERRTIGEV